MDGFEDHSAVLRSGVYALLYRGVVVYIGKSKVPLVRIYSHRSVQGRVAPKWLPIKGIVFDQIMIRPTRVEDLDKVERVLIDRYRPKYNVQLKPPASVPVSRRV